MKKELEKLNSIQSVRNTTGQGNPLVEMLLASLWFLFFFGTVLLSYFSKFMSLKFIHLKFVHLKFRDQKFISQKFISDSNLNLNSNIFLYIVFLYI